MAFLETESVRGQALTREDYTADGTLDNKAAELEMVIDFAEKAEAWVGSKQWQLLWRDADISYQAPKPWTVHEGSYVLQPTVRRFTVAKVCQSIVPQMFQGLTYANPPFLMRPRAGTKKETIDAKTAVVGAFLDEMEFSTQLKRALEQFVHMGTCIVKWGVEYKEICIERRKSSEIPIPGATQGDNTSVTADEEPQIEEEYQTVCCPYFEFRDIRDVLIDPKLEVPDIREAGAVADKRMMNFYEIDALREDEDYDIPADLIDLWFPPAETDATRGQNAAAEITLARPIVHHAELPDADTGGDPLLRKLEVLEYWDKKRTIVVLNRKKTIKSKENKHKCLPFLSANYWNVPKAFWGIGVGLIVGQNQMLDQGVITAVLKLLDFATNPLLLRSRDTNTPVQPIRSSLGKIQVVDGDIDKAYKYMETPKVDGNVWNVLKENQQATESSTGADALLSQGVTGGPRSSMGRTAGGAGILAGANATRLDGPLDNFINQVYLPFLYILDRLIFRYISDSRIKEILGDELGKEYAVNMSEFHSAKAQYDVLVGAKLKAKQNIAQSLTLITQMFSQGQIQQSLNQVGKYVDYRPILRLWLQSSEVGPGIENDIIRDLTPEMKQALQSKQSGPAQQKAAFEQQKFAEKQQLEDQQTNNRIKRDLTREAFKAQSSGEVTEGEPIGPGFGSQE